MSQAAQVKPISKTAYAPLTLWRRWLRRRQLSSCVQKAYTVFSDRYPVWADELFDEWFLSHHAASLLERYVTGPTPPTAMELAAAWNQQFGGPDKNRKRRIAEMTPVAAEFLHLVEEALQPPPPT